MITLWGQVDQADTVMQGTRECTVQYFNIDTCCMFTRNCMWHSYNHTSRAHIPCENRIAHGAVKICKGGAVSVGGESAALGILGKGQQMRSCWPAW